MKISSVIANIKLATSLKVEHKSANCAICHRRASNIVAIYAPRGESIPLCGVHLEGVEQVVQARLTELGKK